MRLAVKRSTLCVRDRAKNMYEPSNSDEGEEFWFAVYCKEAKEME